MKKIFLILLICAYAVATMGVGFKEFYCCGKLKSVFISLTGAGKQNCTKDCCKTRQHFLKLSDNHVASTDVYLPAKHFAALHFYAPTVAAISFAQHTAYVNSIHAPPPYSYNLPLYLSNCVFRI